MDSSETIEPLCEANAYDVAETALARIDRLEADLAAKDGAIDTLNEWFEKAKARIAELEEKLFFAEQAARNYETALKTSTEIYHAHMANAEERIAALEDKKPCGRRPK